jgi:hypothetical protein
MKRRSRRSGRIHGPWRTSSRRPIRSRRSTHRSRRISTLRVEHLEVRRVLAGEPVVNVLSVGGSDDTVSSLAGDRTVDGQGEPSLLVTILSGGTTLGLAPADATGRFTYTLTDDNLTLIGQGGGKSVVASQTNINGTGTSPLRAFAVDTVGPTIAITSSIAPTIPLTSGATASLTIQLSEPSTTFTQSDLVVKAGTISNFSGSGANYTATFTPPATFSGPVTLAADAGVFTDAAGNPSVASNDVTLLVDTLPPVASTTPDLVPQDDSGANNTDNKTNVLQPRFTGSAEPGSTVTLLATAPTGGTTKVGETTASSLGDWTVQAAGYGGGSFAFTDGTWQVRAIVTDAAGNPSPLSAALEILINTVPVVTPTIALDTLSDTGAYANDGVTKVTTPTFLGTAPAGTTVTVFRLPQSAIVPEAIGSVVVGDDGQWLLPFGTSISKFTDGFYTITATAADTAGNVSAVATLATGLTVDTQAPTLVSLAAAATPANQAVPSVDATFDEELFGLVAADFDLAVTSGGLRRSISIAGTATVATESGGVSDDDWDITGLSSITGSSGSYQFALRQSRFVNGKSLAADRAGNTLLYSTTAATWNTDTTAPRVTSMTVNPSPTPVTTASPWNTSVSSVDVVFDENVTGVDPSDFELARDGVAVSLAAATITGAGRNWRVGNLAGVTTTDGSYTLTLKAATSGITDTAGSGNPLFSDSAATWRIDRTPPTAVFDAIGTPRTTAVDSVTLTFAEPVSGVEKGDFKLTLNGSPVALSSLTLSPASGPASTYVLSGLLGFTRGDGTYALSFGKDAGTTVTDAAGNAMAVDPTAVTWTTDSTKPTATIAQPTPSLVNTAVASVDVTFTLPVSGVDAGDFQLTRNGVVVSLAGAAVSANSATSYTLWLPPAATQPDGAYMIRLSAVGSGIAGTSLPNNPLTTDATTTWTMDATRPSVSLSVIQRVGSKATVRALFSESVAGFNATDIVNDITIAGGTIGNARNGALVGREYLFDVTPTPADPILPVTLGVNDGAASDAAGNPSIASDALRIISDTTPPSVVLTGPAATNQSPYTVTATFSEPVTGLSPVGVVVTNGTVTNIAGSGTTWTIDVTPTNLGVVTVSLPTAAAIDGSDIPSLPSNQLQTVYDNVAPTVVITSLSGSPSRAEVILISATFSESVTGVVPASLNVIGSATVVGVTGSGSVYTFQVRPDTDGTISVSVPSGAAGDAAGNGNESSNELVIDSDRTPPRVLSMTGPVNGIITITFSEQVTGFDIGDFVLTRNGQSVSLSGAFLSGPSGPNSDTWQLTLGTAAGIGGAYRLQIAASSAGIRDLAGNVLPDDRSSPFTTLISNFTIDTTPPTATFTGVGDTRNVALDSIGLVFSEAVTGVDLADLVLTRDGAIVGRLDTLPGVSLTRLTGASYVITGLAPFAGIAGRYVIQLVAASSGIVDLSGNGLLTSTSGSWALDLTPPTATFGAIAAVVSGPISNVPVSFSETVRGLDLGDFLLTRDGTPVPLTGATLVPSTSGAPNFQVANLLSLTGVAGNYILKLRFVNTGISDVAGNFLPASVAVSWRNAGTLSAGALVGGFGAVIPNPRTVPVSSVALSFTAGVTGVGPEDFRLTRTVGGVTSTVPTTGLTVNGSGASWTVGGLSALTQTAGDYVLRLVASGSGVRTSTGVVLRSDVVTSWRMVATPAAPTAAITMVAPATAGAAYDGAAISFNKDVTGLKLSSFVLVRGTVPVSLTGTVLIAVSPSSYRLIGLAPLVSGAMSYELRLVASGSGIVGTDGSTFQTNASVAWTQVDPSVRAAFLGVDRVTTAPIAAAKLRFSEAVRGVDVTDFELTVDRNDGRGPQAVALRGVTVSGSGTSWTVGNLGALQAGPGRYVLRLKKTNGDIVSGGGRALAEDATLKWTLT